MAKTIIIEGVDGAGKTTVANWLGKEHNFTYRHEGPPPPGRDQFAHYARTLWRALQAREPVVFDRFHLGEMIYGHIKRDHDGLGYYGVRLFNRVFHAQPAICVIAVPPYETCVRSWREKLRAGDDYLGNEVMYWDSYHRYVGLGAYHHVFDYEGQDIASQFDGWMAGPQFRSPMPEGVIGNPAARFLVVGEQVNHTDTDLPFFSDGHASRFLNEALWEAGYTEEEMMFTNALTRRGKTRNLAAITRHLPNFQLALAFGDVAKDECTYRDLPHIALTHPACLRRFFFKKRGDFVKRLRSIREEVRC